MTGGEGGAQLVRIQDLRTWFPVRARTWSGRGNVVRAVDGVSLEVDRAQTLGLVGESGCGKSTLGRSLLRLIEPSSGRIWFDGQEVTAMSRRELRNLRRRMQIVFQDPFGSLNPRMTVRQTLAEPLRLHGLVRAGREEVEQVVELLERVGLKADAMPRYPHEFSGGQRQRICIARALAVQPDFVVADEPVSALDVSIQAQVVNLLMDLQQELGIAFLFIAHDLHVVEHVSHRVAVMYLGRVVEQAAAVTLRSYPRHPYTKALYDSVPEPRPSGTRRHRQLLSGEVPSPLAPPAGCSFHPRCPIAEPGLCDQQEPQMRLIAAEHLVACHLAR